MVDRTFCPITRPRGGLHATLCEHCQVAAGCHFCGESSTGYLLVGCLDSLAKTVRVIESTHSSRLWRESKIYWEV